MARGGQAGARAKGIPHPAGRAPSVPIAPEKWETHRSVSKRAALLTLFFSLLGTLPLNLFLFFDSRTYNGLILEHSLCIFFQTKLNPKGQVPENQVQTEVVVRVRQEGGTKTG